MGLINTDQFFITVSATGTRHKGKRCIYLGSDQREKPSHRGYMDSKINGGRYTRQLNMKTHEAATITAGEDERIQSWMMDGRLLANQIREQTDVKSPELDSSLKTH